MHPENRGPELQAGMAKLLQYTKYSAITLHMTIQVHLCFCCFFSKLSPLKQKLSHSTLYWGFWDQPWTSETQYTSHATCGVNGGASGDTSCEIMEIDLQHFSGYVNCPEMCIYIKYIRSTWLFRQVGCLVETRLSCVCHGFTLPAIQNPMGRFRRMRVS